MKPANQTTKPNLYPQKRKVSKMTLEEAIERQTRMANEAWDQGREKDADACQLSIEALKRLEQNRTLHFIPSLKLLPDETKE